MVDDFLGSSGGHAQPSLQIRPQSSSAIQGLAQRRLQTCDLELPPPDQFGRLCDTAYCRVQTEVIAFPVEGHESNSSDQGHSSRQLECTLAAKPRVSLRVDERPPCSPQKWPGKRVRPSNLQRLRGVTPCPATAMNGPLAPCRHRKSSEFNWCVWIDQVARRLWQ